MIFTLSVLVLIQFIINVEMSVVMPLAPIIALTFNIIGANVPLLNLGFSFSGLLSPIFGYKADKSGIKKMIVLSMFLFSFGCLIVSLKNMYLFIIGRFILGIGYFNLTSLVTTYTTKLISNEKLGFISGIYKVAFSLGTLVSPILALYVSKNNNFEIIYFYLFLIGLIISFCTFAFKEVNNSNNLVSIKDVKVLLKDKAAILYMFAVLLLTIPSVYFYSFTSLYLNDLGFDQSYISKLYSVVAIGAIIGGVLIIMFSKSIGLERMNLITSFLAALFLSIFIISRKWIFLGFLFGVCYDTVWGLFYPVGSTFYKNKVATFLTILASISSLTNFFANMIGPYIYKNFGYPTLIIISSISLFICTLLMKLSYKIIDNQKKLS